MTTTTTPEIEYARTLGTVTTRGQVHIAHGRAGQQRVCCRHQPKVFTTDTIADTTEGCGPEATAALLAAAIAPRRLCGSCWGPQFRIQYAGAFAAAAGGAR